MTRIFEADGVVAVTDASLRAVEELVAESVRRHDEHRARMAGTGTSHVYIYQE
jgi:hypothetical protein